MSRLKNPLENEILNEHKCPTICSFALNLVLFSFVIVIGAAARYKCELRRHFLYNFNLTVSIVGIIYIYKLDSVENALYKLILIFCFSLNSRIIMLLEKIQIYGWMVNHVKPDGSSNAMQIYCINKPQTISKRKQQNNIFGSFTLIAWFLRLFQLIHSLLWNFNWINICTIKSYPTYISKARRHQCAQMFRLSIEVLRV